MLARLDLSFRARTTPPCPEPRQEGQVHEKAGDFD
jgi:hypothetical protein